MCIIIIININNVTFGDGNPVAWTNTKNSFKFAQNINLIVLRSDEMARQRPLWRPLYPDSSADTLSFFLPHDDILTERFYFNLVQLF